MKAAATQTITKQQQALLGDGAELPARITYAARERAGVHVQKQRIAIRAKKGKDWDGKAANDNIAWPLATALIREGNTELLKAAMYYRKVHDTAKSNAMLGGTAVNMGDGIAIDHRQWIKPNGQVAYKGVRTVASHEPEQPARKKAKTDAEEQSVGGTTESGYTNIPKPWRGDEPVNDKIDAQHRLVALRSRLGVLVEPLEMSVVDGATYREVGNANGIANKAGAEGAGRALVHTALISLMDMIGKISRRHLE